MSEKNINLKPVKIAVIDSGVLAATKPIKNILRSSYNMTEDTNENHWLSHATMITSLFAGVVHSSNENPIDVYAPNSEVNSIKITFAGDEDNSTQQKYGSMQLAVALDQAVSEGAQLVNLSLTYNSKPDDNIAFAEKGIMAAAAKKGILFVTAAGNENSNIDEIPVYPGAYDVDNIVVVGSHTANLQRASSSNYGNSVDVTAQGASVEVNNKFGLLDTAGGTSFATPIAVSALSLYLGLFQNKQISSHEVLSDLFNSSDNFYTYNYGLPNSRYGRLNAYELIIMGLARGANN
jgi:subtilisin family serine protease